LVGVRVYGDINYFCGGTIIGPLTILTAAHCLFDPIPNSNEVKVVVAKHLYSSSESDTK
jgi:secreted trypsin-like serine protease